MGSHEWKGGLDLFNIVLVGIADELPERDEKYEMHRLLGTLLSIDLSSDEKLSIIENEYAIPIEDGIRKDVSVMCNLSQGIREKGRIEGRTEGRTEGETKFIISMYKKGYTLEQIADVAEKSVEEIKTVIENREPALV